MKVYTVCEKIHRWGGLEHDWLPNTTWSTRSGAEEEMQRIMSALDILRLTYRKQDYKIDEVEVDPIG